MSLSTTIDYISQAGNGSTTAFNFPYLTFADADLVVIVKDNTTGAETVKTLGTHYTISGTLTNGKYSSGCTVNFLTAPVTGQTVIVYRDKSVTQDLDLDENGKIPAESLETQLDKLTTYIQRVKNKLARTIGLKEGYTASFDPSLPNIMVNDGYIKTKADGSGVEYISQDDLINTINTSSSDFTANRALQSSSSGLAEVSNVTSTELGYLSGVTSAIQTQINSKEPTITTLPISKGGTNSATALTNSKVMVSTADSIIESVTTTTQLSYLDATSSIQTQLNNKIGLLGVVTRTSTYIATIADGLIQCSGAAFNVTLYTAVGNGERRITIKKTDTSLTNIITILFNGAETANGQTSLKLFIQHDSYTLVSNGTTWDIVGSNIKPVIVEAYCSANKSPTTSTPVDFDTKITDSHNLVTGTGGSSWRITFTRSGLYEVTVNQIYLTSGTAYFAIWKTGSFAKTLTYSTTNVFGEATLPIDVVSGDYIDIRPNGATTVRGGAITTPATEVAKIYVKEVRL